ncbi:MAG: L,D-transpeptidase family protein, partial [bacterium]|nr:L,D-transpeptidase family protein [bacterium]
MYLRKGKTRKTSYVFWIIVAIFSGVFVSSMATNGALEIYSYLKSDDFKSSNNLVYSYKSQAIGVLKNGFAAVGESADGARNVIKDIKNSLGIIAMADYENGKNISKGKFIKADLSEMRLSLFEDGEKVKDFDILAKGREGSPWETPSGQYSILSKEENHLSSIGLVWMPYSMQFFGNFFIHGWPINMDGTDVPEGYSGGCIRLSREDAGEVFKFAEINTPINIIGGGDNADSFSGKYYNLRSGKGRLNISAKAYLAADMESGEILLSENKDDVLPIASITKLVTALVSLDVIN